MAITISGENNNDRITAQDGVIDTISGFNISGIITASSFTGDLTGDVTGNVTGNINNSTLLLQTGSTERVRITSDGKISTGALASPDGNLHVYSSSAGSVTAASDAKELVLESSANVGMSFLTASNSLSRIKFGDSRQSNRGVIAYNHSVDCITFHTVGNERLRITSGGDILIGRTTGLTDAKVSIQCDAGESGIAVQLNTGTGTSNLLQAYSSAGPNVASITVNPTATPDLMFNVWDGSSTTERLRITSTGKFLVGIHTSSEAYTWQPRARFAVESSGDSSSIHLGLRYGGSADPAIMMLRRGGSTAWHHHVGRIYTDHYPAIYFQTSFAGAPGSENFQTHMVMKHNAGVGIGTNNPTKLLEIFGTDPTIKLMDSSGDAYALIEADSADQGSIRFRADPLGAGSGTHIRFDTDGTERLRIDSSGRLLVSGQAALTSTSLNHPIQVAAASDATSIAIFGRAADDIAELDFYENDKTTKLGELQYRQDHLNLRHRVGYISFATGGVTERLRITSDGNLMLGTSTAAITAGIGMMIANSGGARIKLCDSDLGVDGASGYEMIASNNGTAYLWNRENTHLLFGTNNTERFRIDSSGNVSVGTAPSSGVGLLNIRPGSGDDSYLKFRRAADFNASFDGTAIDSRNGGNSANKDLLVRFNKLALWAGGTEKISIANDGKATFNEQLTISNTVPGIKLIDSANSQYAFIDGNSGNLTLHSDKGASGSSSYLKFAVDNHVKMTIGHSGRVGVAESDTGISGYAENFQVRATYGTGQYGIAIKLNHSSGSLMRFSNSSGLCGSITSSGSNSTSFNTSSDYRLKENDVKISDGISRLKQLRPIRFNWKLDSSSTEDGFFAHEVSPVVPESVTGEKDAPIDEIGEGYQKIDHSKLVPLLTAALQEAVARIEALEGS